MQLIHIEYQASELVVHNFSAMAPGFLNEVVDSQWQVEVHEIHILRIVENLQKTRCDEISVKRETSVLPEEIIITMRWLNAN